MESIKRPSSTNLSIIALLSIITLHLSPIYFAFSGTSSAASKVPTSVSMLYLCRTLLCKILRPAIRSKSDTVSRTVRWVSPHFRRRSVPWNKRSVTIPQKREILHTTGYVPEVRLILQVLSRDLFWQGRRSVR